MIKTSELVNRIFLFCETLTGRKLFPYQAQASKRLIRSLLEDDGAEITLLMARQMGKCFGKGTSVLMANGSVKRVEHIKAGDKVMTPEGGEATVIEVHSGEGALYKVEDTQSGRSYVVNSEHLLVLRGEDGKKVISVKDYMKTPFKERESWRGMRKAIEFKEQFPKMPLYTEGFAISKGFYSYVDDSCIYNSRVFREQFLKGVIEGNNGFEYEPVRKTVEISFSNPVIASKIEFIARSLGIKVFKYLEDSKYFLLLEGNLKFLGVSEETPVDEYTYPVKITPVKSGKYFGFSIDSKDKEFLLEDFTVVHNSEVVAATTCGCSIIIPILASMPMFETDKRLDKYRNRDFMCSIYAPSQTQSQIIFSRIKRFVTSPTAQQVFCDPEINVKFGTFNGEQVTLYLQNLGISAKIDCRTASDNSNVEGNSCMLMICDEAQDIGTFKYEKSLSPMCSHYNGTRVLIGTPTTQKGFFYDRIETNKKQAQETGVRDHFEYDYTIGCKYNPQYEKYVTKEMVKNGFDSDVFRMAYRLHWIFERGMFVTDEFKLPPYALFDMDRSHSCKDAKVVVGIDVGKKQDSTVVTVGIPDYDSPCVVQEADKPDVPDFVMYDVKIIDWLEILGDDYNKQYEEILDYLSNFNVSVVVMDATGVGTALYDWLNAAVKFPLIPFTFTGRSKSDLAKNLDMYIKHKCIHYASSKETMETREYTHFIDQFLKAEKNYRGQDMVVAHPELRNAHDDYLYSAALMCWGINQLESVPETVDNSNIFSKYGHEVQSTTNIISGYLAKRR